MRAVGLVGGDGRMEATSNAGEGACPRAAAVPSNATQIVNDRVILNSSYARLMFLDSR